MPRHPDGEMWDIFENSSRRKMYTYKEITVDGLHCFGWQNFKMKTLYIPQHYHKDCFEFHYVQDGSITFQVDGEDYTVSGGNVFVNYPNESHGTHVNPFTGHKMYWFNLKVQKQILGLSRKQSQLLLERLQNIKHRIIPANEWMKSLIKEVFKHVCSDSPYYQHYAATQMASFLYLLAEEETTLKSPSLSPEVQRAIGFMKKNVHHHVDLKAIASHAGFSLSYFKDKFKKETGITPTDYYVGLRIDEAKRMLAEGYSVTETSNALDFSSPNYFSTAFHRIVTMTPTEYIKEHNQKVL